MSASWATYFESSLVRTAAALVLLLAAARCSSCGSCAGDEPEPQTSVEFEQTPTAETDEPETTAVVEPATPDVTPEPEPEPEPQLAPAPEPKPRPTRIARRQNIPRHKPKPRPEPEIAPKPEPEPEFAPEPEPEPERTVRSAREPPSRAARSFGNPLVAAMSRLPPEVAASLGERIEAQRVELDAVGDEHRTLREDLEAAEGIIPTLPLHRQEEAKKIAAELRAQLDAYEALQAEVNGDIDAANEALGGQSAP